MANIITITAHAYLVSVAWSLHHFLVCDLTLSKVGMTNILICSGNGLPGIFYTQL